MQAIQTESVSGFRNNYKEALTKIENGPVLLLQNSKAAAVLVSLEEWNTIAAQLKRLQQLEALAAAKRISAEMKADPAKRITHDDLISTLTQGFTPTGHFRRDVATFLTLHNQAPTAGHVVQVAAEAQRLAERFGADVADAEVAGLLHDISAVIPNEERIAAAQAFGLEVLPEEATFPMIIHQKLSVVLAREIFGITAPAPLSAIGCHTTLKADASLLDKVVFVADKIRWDQAGTPPYWPN